MKGSLKFNPKSHRCRKPSCVMQLKLCEVTISMKLMSPMSVVNLADSLRTSYGPWNKHRSKSDFFHAYMDQLLTETVLFYWDCFDLSIQAKNSITGIGRIGDWADKLAAFKSSHPTQRSSSSNLNSQHARTISSTSAATSLLTQDPQETPVSAGTHGSSPTDRASSPTDCTSSPTNKTQPTSESQECDHDPYIQGSNACEHKVMPNPSSRVVQRTNAMVGFLLILHFSGSNFWVAHCRGH